MDRCFVADREFVKPCGYGPVAFEAVDPALDRVPLLVDAGVEVGWAATCLSTVTTMPDLVGGLGNRACDPAPPEIGAVGTGTVSLVRQHSIRSGPGPAASSAGDPDPGQYRLELRRVTTLARGHQQGQWFLALFGGQVQLGGPATP